MGLFGLGKKEEKKPSKLEFERLPALPEFPTAEEEVSELPHYEPSISELKKEVSKRDDFSEIPIREKKVMPVMGASKPAAYTSSSEEKPLFIKIDHYKEALRAVDTLKAKILEAEKVLQSLEEIRDQENSKLESWKSEIQALKDKLLTIDQSLFEA